MDTQRKKGVLDICVLAVLARGASYGYKIVGDVSQCIEISESTLYPILRRLEASGCVTTYRQAHRPHVKVFSAYGGRHGKNTGIFVGMERNAEDLSFY